MKSRLKEAGKGALRNQAAMVVLAQKLGDCLQGIAESNLRSQIDSELAAKHAEIENILTGGQGVLVIINLAEWRIPYETGHRSRRLLGVYILAGATQETALDAWLGSDRLIHGADDHREQRYEEYMWIDPNR